MTIAFVVGPRLGQLTTHQLKLLKVKNVDRFERVYIPAAENLPLAVRTSVSANEIDFTILLEPEHLASEVVWKLLEWLCIAEDEYGRLVRNWSGIQLIGPINTDCWRTDHFMEHARTRRLLLEQSQQT